MATDDPILGRYGSWVLSNVSEMFTKTELYKQISNYFAKLGHTHTKSNITDFSHTHSELSNEINSKESIFSSDFELVQTLTIATGVTVNVYANDFMVYIKYSGTATLTANTNSQASTRVFPEYVPYVPPNVDYAYEYGLIGHANANIYGAVNEKGALYIINKTSTTSTTVYGTIKYPRKSVINTPRTLTLSTANATIQTGDSNSLTATAKTKNNKSASGKTILFFAER